MPTAALNGIEVYYEQRGTGPRVLFANGSGSTLAEAALIVDVLAAGCEVVAHDQRGLGKTEVPPGPYTMADYAADAIALLDHVGWERCRVLGISFGGMVAQELAVTVPERVERLALLCTSPGGEGGSSYPLHELGDRPPAEQAAIGLSILDTRFTPEWLASHPSDQALVEMMVARRSQPDDPEQARGKAEQLGARRNHDVWDRLGRITCPTLVAGGRYDGIAPPANSEAIASRIADADLRFYEGGHAFLAQDPAAFPDVQAFLKS
ncbi:MAG: alpha/beta fold hydrolase [Acidimicrobiales bacterium]|nr:alpha/beta fold hydrolase [Acidimicrobiales bacterium]